jgi:ABC-type amino acid transport substrate-binding protein
LIAALAWALALSACGGAQDVAAGDNTAASSEAATPAAAGGGSANQTVTVAVTPTMPYIGLEGDELTGLDGDLFLEAADRLGLEVNAVAVDFPGLLAGVQSGRYDLGIGNISWKQERAEAGIFTDPPYYSPVILAQQPGVEASTVADLEGRKLATVQSFFYIPALEQVPESTLQTYPNFQAVLQDLAAGRVDIAFLDPLTVVFTKKQNPELEYETAALEPPSAADLEAHPEYAAFLPSMSGWYLNAEQEELRDALNAEILDFYESGFAAQVVEKWGGNPDDMLTPIPEFTDQRIDVDRPEGWSPPSS